jgi:hypothetical protein
VAKRSQMLMRARVIAQAVAIVAILGALFFFGRGLSRLNPCLGPLTRRFAPPSGRAEGKLSPRRGEES